LIISPLFSIPVIDAAIIPHRIVKVDAEGLSVFAIILMTAKLYALTICLDFAAYEF